MLVSLGRLHSHIKLAWLSTETGSPAFLANQSFSRKKKQMAYDTPHKDAIVIPLRIAGRKVYKILIDNWSSADILFRSTLNKMNLIRANFEPVKSYLYCFTRNNVSFKGVLNLSIELRTHHCQHIQVINFVVIDCPSSYNAIIERPTTNAIQTVTSTYNLLVKFLIVGGIGVFRGYQQESRDIYKALNRPLNVYHVSNIKTSKNVVTTHPPDTIMIGSIEVKINEVRNFNELNPREPAMEQHGEPAEELVEVPLFEDDPSKIYKIRSSLTRKLRTNLINFLCDHHDVFAWSHEDMLGIDPKVIVHHLNIDPSF